MHEPGKSALSTVMPSANTIGCTSGSIGPSIFQSCVPTKESGRVLSDERFGERILESENVKRLTETFARHVSQENSDITIGIASE